MEFGATALPKLRLHEEITQNDSEIHKRTGSQVAREANRKILIVCIWESQIKSTDTATDTFECIRERTPKRFILSFDNRLHDFESVQKVANKMDIVDANY